MGYGALFKQTDAHTHAETHMCIHVRINTYVHASIHAYLHSYRTYLPIYTHLHACMHACMHIYTHTHALRDTKRCVFVGCNYMPLFLNLLRHLSMHRVHTRDRKLEEAPRLARVLST